MYARHHRPIRLDPEDHKWRARPISPFAIVVVLLWLIVAYGRAPYLPTWGMLAPWALVVVVLCYPPCCWW
jgi:hypothetical protein